MTAPEKRAAAFGLMGVSFGLGFVLGPAVGNPSNYNWNGKHPFVIGNSCYIGNTHLNADGASTSEDWVMRPAAGPIAFLAATQIGLAFNLASYSYGLYESIGSVNYGKPFGKHMKHAAASLLTNQNNWGTVYTVHTFTLQGDPMLVVNSPLAPDFDVQANDITFDPAVVSADVDTFSVKVAVRNIGRIIPGTVGVQLQRTNAGLPAPIIYNGQAISTSPCFMTVSP